MRQDNFSSLKLARPVGELESVQVATLALSLCKHQIPDVVLDSNTLSLVQ